MNRRCETCAFPKIGAPTEHTRREARSRRRTLHGIATGPKTGTAPRYVPVPVEGAATIARAAESQCTYSAERIGQRPRHGHANVAAPARHRGPLRRLTTGFLDTSIMARRKRLSAHGNGGSRTLACAHRYPDLTRKKNPRCARASSRASSSRRAASPPLSILTGARVVYCGR